MKYLRKIDIKGSKYKRTQNPKPETNQDVIEVGKMATEHQNGGKENGH